MPTPEARPAISKWISRVWGLAAVLVVGVLLYVGYLFFFPTVPVTIYSLHIDTPAVSGHTITERIYACKHVDLPSTVISELIGVKSAVTVTFPVRHGALTTGCHHAVIILALPATTPPGRYLFRNAATYNLPVHGDYTVYSESNVLTVTAG